MMMRKSIIFAGALLLSGCFGGSGGGTTATTDTTTPTTPTTPVVEFGLPADANISVKSMGAKVIGDGSATAYAEQMTDERFKPRDDEAATDSTTDGGSDAAAQMTKSFLAVPKNPSTDIPLYSAKSTVTTDPNVLSLTMGQYNKVQISLNVDKDYQNVPVMLTLNSRMEGTDASVPMGVLSRNLVAGDNTIEADVFVPTNLVEGDYVLNFLIVKDDLDKKFDGTKTADQIPELGGINVGVVKDPNIPLFDIPHIELSSGYIDLIANDAKDTDKFVDGYTAESVGVASLPIYGTSAKDEDITLSAWLIMPDGRRIDFALQGQDNNQVIEANHIVSGTLLAGDSTNLSVPYFLKKEDVDYLMTVLPDVEKQPEGLTATVGWMVDRLTGEDDEYTYYERAEYEGELGLTQFIDPVMADEAALADASAASAPEMQSKATAASASGYVQNALMSGELFSYNASLSPRLGNDKIGLTTANNYELSARWDRPSVSAKALSQIIPQVFGKDFHIFSVRGEAHAGLKAVAERADVSNDAILMRMGRPPSSRYTARVSHKSGAQLTAYFLGSVIYQKSTLEEERLDGLQLQPWEISPPPGRPVYANPPEKVSSSKTSKADKQKLVDKSKAKKKTQLSLNHEWNIKVPMAEIPLAPFPMTITVLARGSLATEVDFGMEGLSVTATAAVPADLQGIIEGAANAGIAKAGVRGTLTLLETKPEVKFSAGIVFDQAESLGNFTFAVQGKSTADLNLLRGDIGLFAQYYGPKVCSGLFPCGWGWQDEYKSLYKSPWAFSKSWTIFDKRYPIMKVSGGF